MPRGPAAASWIRSPSRSSSGRSLRHCRLFLTAGGNRVDAAKATELAGEPLGKADAALVRAETGFAIGGVAPIGHLKPVRAWWDPRLSDFDVIWAAAGTPRHVFAIAPDTLLRIAPARNRRISPRRSARCRSPDGPAPAQPPQRQSRSSSLIEVLLRVCASTRFHDHRAIEVHASLRRQRPRDHDQPAGTSPW